MAQSQGSAQSDELAQLLRAYELLTATSDDQRVVAGALPKAWIHSEVEQMVALSDIPTAFFHTLRGKEVLLQEIHPDHGQLPETFDVEPLLKHGLPSSILINSNRLNKLEPSNNAQILTSVLLAGVQLYGNNGRGLDAIDQHLIVATLVRDCLGKAHRHSAWNPEQWLEVDLHFIREHLGESVAKHLHLLNEYLTVFDANLRNRGTLKHMQIAPEYANAIAAIATADLRLMARLAGEDGLSLLSAEQRQILKQQGVAIPLGDFPEKHFLERHYHRAKLALGLPGVDYAALIEPITHTLLYAVEDVLEAPDKRQRLIGRRGRAIHELHMNLPLMELYNATEHPNDVMTVHVAALEVTRHLDKGRRKSFNTMAGHAMHVGALMSQAMGEALEPSMAITAILHDVVEDGCLNVSGYNHSLQKLKQRFGGPVAAMVSEVTEAHCLENALLKAETTQAHHVLANPRQQYDVDRFTPMQLQASDHEQPFTITGILVKLLDTAVTYEEGVRHPDVMNGYWRHSGIRVYWSHKIRGTVVRPLVERLVRELKLAESDPYYSERMGSYSPGFLLGIRRAVTFYLDAADLYATMNLCLLSGEYSLTWEQLQTFRAKFFDDSLSSLAMGQWLKENLDEEALDANIASGFVPARDHVSVFPIGSSCASQRDDAIVLTYRKNALWRRNVRASLGLDGASRMSQRQQQMDEVVGLYLDSDLSNLRRAELLSLSFANKRAQTHR